MRHGAPPFWLVTLIIFVYGGLFYLSLKNPDNCLKRDSAGYLALAANLRHHHVFSKDAQAPFSLELIRLPGYPLFLAMTGATTSSFGLALGLQCLSGIAMLFLIWPWAYRLGGKVGASLGSLFLCVDPVLVLHQNLLLTEALTALVLTAAISLALDYFENPSSSRRAIFAGLFFGAGALIKPINLFPAILFFICAVRNRRSACLLALVTFSLPLAWTVRNWVETGRFVYTVQGGHDLFIYPAANALALDAHCTKSEALAMMEKSLRDEGFRPGENPSADSAVYEKKAIEIMKQHPWATVKVHFKGVRDILGGTGLEMLLDLLNIPRPGEQDPAGSGGGTLRMLKRYPVLSGIFIVNIIFLVGGYLLFLRGAWALAQRGQWTVAAFLSLTVLVILAVSAHQGYYRFRLPMVPFFAFGIAAAFVP